MKKRNLVKLICGAGILLAGAFGALKKFPESDLYYKMKFGLTRENYQENFAPAISSVVEKSFDEKSKFSLEKIASQTALFDTDINSDLLDNGVVKSEHKYGQVLLLPFKTRDGFSTYFFVTAKHNLDGTNHRIKKFFLGENEIYFGGVLASSSEKDIAFGWVYGPSNYDLESLPFSSEISINNEAIIFPCQSSEKFKLKPVRGIVARDFKDYFVVDAPVCRGYSGSPVIVKGKVAGFVTNSLSGGFAGCTKAKNVREILEKNISSAK